MSSQTNPNEVWQCFPSTAMYSPTMNPMSAWNVGAAGRTHSERKRNETKSDDARDRRVRGETSLTDRVRPERRKERRDVLVAKPPRADRSRSTAFR